MNFPLFFEKNFFKISLIINIKKIKPIYFINSLNIYMLFVFLLKNMAHILIFILILITIIFLLIDKIEILFKFDIFNLN